MLASGACSAAALARSRTMEALVLKRSSRVMPGLRGTPAGMTTISAPLRASARPEGVASWPRTWACQLLCVIAQLARRTSLLVLMWPMSAATPGESLVCIQCVHGQQLTYRVRGGCRRERAC
jgi:hypothetical protein